MNPLNALVWVTGLVFALLGAFMGVVGVYIMLAADFVAMVQLLVYVGGILVLTIFAVMLTAGIADVTVSNRAVGTLPALGTVGIVGALMSYAVLRTPWHQSATLTSAPTTSCPERLAASTEDRALPQHRSSTRSPAWTLSTSARRHRASSPRLMSELSRS
jgi:hypothetical protein